MSVATSEVFSSRHGGSIKLQLYFCSDFSILNLITIIVSTQLPSIIVFIPTHYMYKCTLVYMLPTFSHSYYITFILLRVRDSVTDKIGSKLDD